MEKQNSEKKKGLKWILLVAGILVLAAAVGLGLWFLLGGREEQKPTGESHVDIYWNVDRAEYVAANTDGTSGRYPRSEDHLYHIRLAANGTQEDYLVSDYAIVNKIDMLDYFVPVFDEEGIITDVKTINDCTGGLVAPALYVKSVDGNKVIANTQGSFLGVDLTLQIDEETEVYSVGGGSILAGVPGQIAADDEIIAIKDLDGTIGTVFVRAYEPVGDIYWNIYRKYDSTAKVTTRDPDALGYYTFEMALNGELVTVRTRDYKVANNIDAQAAKCMALTFDENGDVASREGTAFAGTNGTFGSWYHVVGINGDAVTAERIAAGSDQGNIMEAMMAPNCKVIDVSAVGGYSGAYTELRIGDQIHGLRDQRGRIAYIFVHVRLSGDEMPLYWNCTRKYNSTEKSTTRTPDAEGWYYAQVATGGEQITVKTKDKALMSSLDSYAARCFTMKLTEDNEIVRLGSASAAHGGSTFGSWYFVDAIEGDQVTVSRILTGNTEPTVVTGTLSPDVEIINGSTNFESHCGEYTQLQVGDRVHGLTDLQKQVRVLFVVDRPVEVPLYWNLTRGYNSTTKSTTKTPDADGFYWYTMATEGKQVKLKVRTKELADKIDSNAACCWGLRVWNGEITQVISVGSVKGYSGGTKSISWVDVVRISGQNVVCQKNQAGHAQDGNTFNTYIGNSCEIYNVSTGYENFAGEPTTLREGDRIHALHDANGIAMVIWVVGGRVKPLNTKPNTCACAEDVVWQPWDGTTELEDGAYYYLTSDVTAPTEGFCIENKEIHIRLDGHTISSDGRVFWTQAGGKLNICDHGTRGKLVGTGIANESGGVIRMYSGSGDAVVNLWNIDVVCNADSTPAKEGGAISCAGPMTLHNVNVKNGVASTKGGNVTVSKYGTFRMFGGKLEGGNAKSGAGGNLNVEGIVYLEDVTLTGGKASGSGDNLFMTGDTYEKRINGLTATNGDVMLSAGKVGVLGTIKADLTMGAGTQLKNMGLESASKINLTMKAEGTVLSNAETDLSGVFTNMDTTGDYVIDYDSKTKAVVMNCTIVPKAHTETHCVCAGVDTGLAAHTCSTLTGWTEITDSVFETAYGTGGETRGIKFKESGNYYLTVPYSLPGGLNIMPDQEITICLNGCRLTGVSQIGRVAGVLNITDCVGSGLVNSTVNSTNGNTYKILAGGELNIYGGTHTSEAPCTDGGIVVVSQDKGGIAPADSTEPGVFNLYGGTIKNGNATNGGNIIVWHSSQFNMYGGTVMDGTSVNPGENIRISNGNAKANLLGGTVKNGDVFISSGTLTVGGSMKIDELNLGGKVAQVSDKGLKADASITINNPGIGTLVSNVSAADYSCFKFTNVDASLTVEYDPDQKTIVAAFNSTHNHCVCGGVKPAGHSCSGEGWMPLNAETVGNYFSVSSSRYVANSSELYLYLTEDLDLTYSINLNNGQTIHLCLNGFDLKHTKTANPVARVWGNLDVTDCSSGRSGSIIGSRTGESPCLYIQNWVGGTQWSKPTVNLFAGTLTADDGNTNSKAGVVQLGNKDNPNGENYATFNMYGGKICGGDATNGGNLYLEGTKVIFNMYGGTITDGNAKSSGGGIYATSGSTMNILGGTITGNAAGALGDDVYTPSSTKVTLGGTVKIGEYYSNAIVLTLKNLNEASSVKLLRNPDASALFATGADTDLSGCFTNPTMTAEYDAAAKTLSFVAGGGSGTEPPVADSDHKHCLCADATGMDASHKCSDTAFVEVTQDDFDNATTDSSPVYIYNDGSNRFALRNGSYYLSENVTLNKPFCLPETAVVSLCLNGKNLHAKNCAALFTRGTLNVTDCDHTTNADGTHTYAGKVTSTHTGHGPALYVRTNGNVSIYGGNLVGNKLGSNAATGGGAVCVGGVLNIYDGKISGGDTSEVKHNGGNMAVMDKGTVNMYGGTITGGKTGTSYNGGNIRINSGTFNMYGGTISDGWAKEGGNVTVASGQTFNMYGGTIEGGTATHNGGNLMVYGLFNMTGGTVKDGVAESNTSTGGNISSYANKTDIRISGGLVTNGKAVTGANIALRTTGTTKVSLTITGGKVQGVQSGSGVSVNIANSTYASTTLGGSAVVDEIRFSGTSAVFKVSTDKPLTTGASIGVSVVGAGQTIGTGVASLNGFVCVNSDYELYLNGTELNIIVKA